MTRRQRITKEREQAAEQIDRALTDIRSVAPQVQMAVARLLAEIEGGTDGGR